MKKAQKKNLQTTSNLSKSQQLLHKQTETMVAVLTDVHIGKQTPEYNIHVAEQVINNFALTLLRLNSLLSANYHFDEFVLVLLGDILDGTNIYPTQPYHQEITAVTAQAWAAAKILLPVIRAGVEIVGNNGKVRVVAVAGNHGRSGKYSHELSNFDLVTYQELEHLVTTMYSNVTVDFNRPIVHQIDDHTIVEYPDMFWLKLVNIRGHYFLLHHGHGARSTYGIPYYGLMRRAQKWRSAMKEQWAALLVGHFHQFGWIEENDIIIMLSGTPVFGDIWALETLGLRGINKTWVFGVSDKRPITWQYAVEFIKER